MQGLVISGDYIEQVSRPECLMEALKAPARRSDAGCMASSG
jgi:hypothetical protein